MSEYNVVIDNLNELVVELDHAIELVAKKQKTLIGQLPFVRDKLYSREIELRYQRARVDAASIYMNATK